MPNQVAQYYSMRAVPIPNLVPNQVPNQAAQYYSMRAASIKTYLT